MLEHLDEIPWEGLTGAYGPATAVPRFLRLLASFDPDEREGAIAALYMGICHQQCTCLRGDRPGRPVPDRAGGPRLGRRPGPDPRPPGRHRPRPVLSGSPRDLP